MSKRTVAVQPQSAKSQLGLTQRERETPAIFASVMKRGSAAVPRIGGSNGKTITL